MLPHPSWLAVPALHQCPGEIIFDLEETLNRYEQILQDLSEHLAQAERQWKQQPGSPGQARPEGAWVSGPQNVPPGLEKLSSLGTGSHGTSGLPVSKKRNKHYTWEPQSPRSGGKGGQG